MLAAPAVAFFLPWLSCSFVVWAGGFRGLVLFSGGGGGFIFG
jgi:hypothetical protein